MVTGMPRSLHAKTSVPAVSSRKRLCRSPSGPRTYLTRCQLDEFRRSLLSKREELIADLLDLDSELYSIQGDADKSDEMECTCRSGQAELIAGLLQAGYNELREVNEAFDRMRDGTYGICQGTGVPIGLKRLRARPWAKYCVEHARSLEKSRQ